MLRTLFPALPDTHFKAWSFNRVVIFKHLLNVKPWIDENGQKFPFSCLLPQSCRSRLNYSKNTNIISSVAV